MIETWVTLGILSGFFYAFVGISSKKAGKNLDGYINGLAYSLFAVPFLVLALLSFSYLGWGSWVAPEKFVFWPATIISVGLNVAGTYLFMRSLAMGDVSLLMPLLSFTPVFLIFTSAVTIGEFPSLIGVVGILLIALGTYVINIKDKKGFIEPIKSLFLNRGAQFMLLAAFLYAILSNLDKIAVVNSNPITFLVIAYSIAGIIFGTLVWKKSKIGFGGVKTNTKLLIVLGLFSALSVIPQMIAYQFSLVSYVIALKRTSGLFGVILGWLAFKEKYILPRLIGSIVMVIGVILISQG